jgi:hypothetical protein
MAQGAQLATDATVYNEVRSQAAKMGADAVIIAGQERRQYAAFPGIATFNQRNSANYGQASGFAMGPSSFSGTHITGIAIKFTR